MAVTETERLVLIVVRDMTVSRMWVCPTEVHRILGLSGVHRAPLGCESEEWEQFYMRTLRTLSGLMQRGFLKEVEVHQHGQLWENFRLTKKGHIEAKGYKAPKEIIEAIKPKPIDFDAIDAALAGGHSTVEKREYVPMRKRRVKVQTRPHWNCGVGYNPIR